MGKLDDSTQNSISLSTAQSYVDEWRGEESTYNKYNECKGFLIPASDLQDLLDEMNSQTGNQFVRAYLGVNPTTQKEKLVLVATTPPSSPGSTVYKDMITGYNGTGLIYDFTEPVPPGSDPLSPLN
ncbi:hypothetical protein [Ulvibacter antarcticus]|uniref:Uncharacterized protein n=1 Tax=Ulvibacter antarcticus TaxID=442714 RepID=A0A3L9YEN0_9FLAO|nr:hypothetical protein [Ulvibacter antarcticus]RMA58844.1 hypothetical protein BXY75_2223 [Ulvibacter antarcticus]